QALKDNPESDEILQNVILVCLDAGRGDQALEVAKKGVELKPNSSQTHLFYGGVALRLKNHELAITELKSAIELKPDYVEAHYGLALAFLAKGDKESALKECAVVEKLNPDAGASLKAEIGQ
ncbi:MAG: tetratricopeptide repeat protein, partial [Blastocatellia bacterium]